jgi:hypothetical protein
MPKEEFENWLDIDNNAEIVAIMTVSEICQAVAHDKYKLSEENKSNCTSKEEEMLEVHPTNAQMREALRIFVVVCNIEQQTAKGIMSMSNCQYEQFIQELLNANKHQAALHKFLK